MRAIAIAAVLLAVVAASGEEISYHGTQPVWTFTGGNYRATWFHVEDFIPGANGFTVEWVEIWLLNMVPAESCKALPSLEIWNEDFTVLLGESQVTGSEVWFSPAVETGEDFWCVLNTEMCTEAVYLLTDGDPDGHSYFSDDWMVWESYDLGEYFIAACNSDAELSSNSWGKLKVMF